VEVWGSGIAGVALLGIFLWHEQRTPAPMLPLGLFKRRNFAIGNLETFAMYGGLSVTFFFLVLFLQQVAGYDALHAGLALMPSTLVMFALSKRAGRLADRLGPRLFMGIGPLVSALGLGLMLRIDAHLNYLTDLLPGLLIFSIGLAATVAPLTATVLADADESNAGIASGVNNAIARVAGLLAVAAIGAVVSAQFNSSLDDSLAGQTLPPPARSAVDQARKETFATVDPAVTGSAVAEDVESASNHAFQVGIGISAALVALGGVLGLAGIRNPRRAVRCEECAGGQFAGQPLDSARERGALTEPATTGA
jgi:Na+/melibiose symporter-like transporter